MVNLLYPENGYVFNTHTDIQDEFINKIHSIGTKKANEWLIKVKNRQESSYPRILEFRWESDDDSERKFYILEIFENDNFECVFRFETEKTNYSVSNLKTGQKYFWRVNGCKVNEFETISNYPRFIRLDGALNVRDIGGNKIKQGLIYRGTEFDEFYALSEQGQRTFIEDLKIKTELDLRGNNENHIKNNPFKDKIKLLQIYYRPYKEIFEERHKKAICEIMEVFADECNYPIYMHCVGGADRTGMLAIYLRSLVGESDEDILTDYELTGLSTYALGITEGVNNPSAEGLRSRNADYFSEFRNMLDDYGKENACFSEKIIAFLLDCGVTQKCIERIIKIIKR